jgi:hypothetical protein
MSWVLRWIDRNFLELGRELRLSYLPPLMVYLAYGIQGLTAIVGTFFVKDYLGLSAAFLAALGSDEITTSTSFWNTSASYAFWAPAALDALSASSIANFLFNAPPASLISEIASSIACNTAGAVTLFAPLNPSGIPNTIGSSSATAPPVENAVTANNTRAFCSDVLIAFPLTFHPTFPKWPAA